MNAGRDRRASPFVRAMARDTFCSRGVHLFLPVLRYHHRGPVAVLGALLLPCPAGWYAAAHEKCRLCGAERERRA